MRAVFSILGCLSIGWLATGCIAATVDVPELCNESSMKFEVPPEALAAANLAKENNLAIPASTVSASTTLNFDALQEIDGNLNMSTSDFVLRFEPGQLDSIQEITAYIQHESNDDKNKGQNQNQNQNQNQPQYQSGAPAAAPEGAVQILKLAISKDAQAANMLSLTKDIDAQLLLNYVRTGPAKLSYSISGNIPAEGLTVKSRTCVAASLETKKSLL